MSVRLVRLGRVVCERDPMNTISLQFSELQDWKAQTTGMVIHDPQCGCSVLIVPDLIIIMAGVIFQRGPSRGGDEGPQIEQRRMQRRKSGTHIYVVAPMAEAKQ